jgi:tetratricopeptide (TPR) repeat protein
MTKLSSTYYSKIYKEFKALDAKEHLSIVRFYESYEGDIKQLNFTEYFELLTAYLDALFEIGAYHSHLKMVDSAIQISILNNIKFYNGRDIYTDLLFRKAASCYNLMHYDDAEHILRELIKISPHDESYEIFLRKCLWKKQPNYLKNARGLTILLLLAAALIIAVELIIVRNLFAVHAETFQLVRNLTFGLAILTLLGSTLTHYGQIYLWVKQFVAECKRRKG